MALRMLGILNDGNETIEPEVTGFDIGTAVTC